MFGGKSLNKGKAAAGSSSSQEFVPGIPRGYTFTEPNPNDNHRYKEDSVVLGVKNHPVEPHEWLQFPGVTGNERVHYLNRLQDLRYKHVLEPKVVSWSDFESLNLKEPILRMLNVTNKNANGIVKTYKMWENVFNCDIAPVQEWVLEFLSTIRVETNLKVEEFLTRKVIHFRDGGIQRHCTVPEFAYLTGMVSRAELNTWNGYEFLREGIYDKDVTGFGNEKSTKDFWCEIGGSNKLSMAVSKVSEIKVPILKVIHRMITHCFLVRSDHNEKVAPNDVWLMRLFYEGSPTTYACAPYVLAKHLASHKDRVLVCGNFICHVYVMLGYDTARNTKGLIKVQCSRFGKDELIGFGLIYEVDGKDVFVGDLPEEQRPVGKRRRDDGSSAPQFKAGSSSSSAFDFSSLQGAVFGLQGTTDMLLDNARTVNSMLHRVLDQQEHFRPMWQRQYEEQYEQQYGQMDEDDRPELPTYTPPAFVPPSQGTFERLFPQESYQQEAYTFQPPPYDPNSQSTGFGLYTGAPRYQGNYFSYHTPVGDEAGGRPTMGTPNIIPGGDFFSEGGNTGEGEGTPSIFAPPEF